MQYHEFLRMAGVSRKEVTRFTYCSIDARYKERGDLFPDKEAVVTHYLRFGPVGFTRQFIRDLDTLRSAILEVKRYYAPATSKEMIDLALTSPDTAQSCW